MKGTLKITIGLMLWLCAISVPAQDKPTLYVFMPTEIRPTAMQSALSSALPELNVLVLGKTKEFQRLMLEEKPDAILIPGPMFKVAEGYQILLSGMRDGKTKEKYIELSAETQINANVEYYGILNIMGRKNTEEFALQFFPGKDRVRLKLVTKLEDLLPLLQYGGVKSIIIPKHNITFFQNKSKLDFKVLNEFEQQIALPILAVNDEGATAREVIAKSIKELPKDVLDLLEVDTWTE